MTIFATSSEVAPGVHMNPGSQDLHGATLLQALANAQLFARELSRGDDTVLVSRNASVLHAGDHGGRFVFTLRRPADHRECFVWMPGVPLRDCHYKAVADQNPWHFARLFISDDEADTWPNDWLWCYALDAASEILFGDPDAPH